MATILVADDDSVMLRLLETLLNLEGFETSTATRPSEIITALANQRFELVLMDYYLAGGSALETLQLIRSNAALRELPVLVTSGLDHETECIDAGANGFILKPFAPDELMSQVRSILGPAQPAVPTTAQAD